MSIETAIKFCELCHVYSSKIGHGNANNDWSSDASFGRFESVTHDFIIGRDDCTHRAMTALEESLTKNRETTPMEDEPKNDVKKVKIALTACLNCDYKQPSIVDIFIEKKESRDNAQNGASRVTVSGRAKFYDVAAQDNRNFP
ncbi:hypothetical protein HZA97_06405 [Candidatus Woesearchaeota archaeon]|nr:hypothetical protein [Candidatus Woesearchaeota archaeon]